LQTPPTPLIDALHCCKVAKVQLGEVPSLKWARRVALRIERRRHARTGQNDRNQDDRNAHQYCKRPIS
jgi:hypothetical protein